MRLYLDANFFIAFVESPLWDFGGVIRRVETAPGSLVTSEFTVAEVLVLPFKTGDLALAQTYEDLWSRPGVFPMVPVSAAVLRRSAEIRATLGNKTPDAIHVATAVETGCTLFLSSDQRIRLPEGLRRVSLEDAARMDMRS